MKVTVGQSFFESLKNLNSFKSKWNSFTSWIRYHTRKEFLNIIKVAFKGYPWQDSFLYELERAKIQEMIEYHKKYQRFVGWEYVVRDMEICVKLINIILEETNLYDYVGDGFHFTPIENSDLLELSSNSQYICNVYVNTKNATRFIPKKENNPCIDYWIEHPHEIYLLKAKYLYHKIRYEHDAEWWD